MYDLDIKVTRAVFCLPCIPGPTHHLRADVRVAFDLKRRQAIAERFAEFLAEGGMDRVQACLKALAVELELVEGCSSPLDYQSCAAARFRQLKSQKSV
mmetsp:Transcript_36152/g.144526  ORF Transcript_36152/g.144526 Transcript_36152/m.144526 type:complete len:98 (+) Transcript_36152:954-1247(+)